MLLLPGKTVLTEQSDSKTGLNKLTVDAIITKIKSEEVMEGFGHRRSYYSNHIEQQHTSRSKILKALINCYDSARPFTLHQSLRLNKLTGQERAVAADCCVLLNSHHAFSRFVPFRLTLHWSPVSLVDLPPDVGHNSSQCWFL